MSGAAFGLPQRHAPQDCPCGSGRRYAQCCRPLHLGQREAATAAELMRSRYSAFAVGDADYLLATWHPATRPGDLRLDPERRWERLDLRDSTLGGPGDDTGTVRYAASWAQGERRGVLRETSRFAPGARSVAVCRR